MANSGFSISFFWVKLTSAPNFLLQLDSGFFQLALLPPIILEGGFSLQRSMFFQNIVPILGLALIGGLFSTLTTGIIMYYCTKFISKYSWSFVESLVFSGLISSTDPISVLALLPSTVDKRLYMLIFGESALNDAVAIILYGFFTNLQSNSRQLGATAFAVSIGATLIAFVGSFSIGFGFAVLFSWATKMAILDDGFERTNVIIALMKYEMLMLILCAYGSYIFAELAGLAGIISIFFCGVFMSHYGRSNLHATTKKSFEV